MVIPTLLRGKLEQIKAKDLRSIILHLLKLSFKIEEEIEVFSNKSSVRYYHVRYGNIQNVAQICVNPH